MTTFEAVEPYSLALFTRVLGWTFEEAQNYVNKVRAELLSFAALEGFWKSDWLSSAVSRAAPVEPRVPLRRKRSLHAP